MRIVHNLVTAFALAGASAAGAGEIRHNFVLISVSPSRAVYVDTASTTREGRKQNILVLDVSPRWSSRNYVWASQTVDCEEHGMTPAGYNIVERDGTEQMLMFEDPLPIRRHDLSTPVIRNLDGQEPGPNYLLVQKICTGLPDSGGIATWAEVLEAGMREIDNLPPTRARTAPPLPR